MAVHRLEAARVRIRTILVSYWPDLDAPRGSEIKLGAFGDLRMGKRYALGLIARSSTSPEDIERVGRLARRLVESPYKTLRERYEEIWAAPHPQDAFERIAARTRSSLMFSDMREKILATSVVNLKDDLETAKNWCMDELRPVLRERFHEWMGTTSETTADEREQLAERIEAQPETARRAVG